jgi:hypothetical protein
MNTGTITEISPRGIMFIVAIDQGDWAVFELLDSIDLAIGDRIKGKLSALGSEELLHLGQGQTFSAFGQSGPSSLKSCQKLIASS